jgi:DNA-binding MarR family transcriptional regulator
MHHMNDSFDETRSPPLTLRVSLSFLVSQLGSSAAQRFGQTLETIGLRYQDAGLLRLLTARPGMTQTEISEIFGVLPSRLVVLLDGLEDKKLLERRRDGVDRRLTRVFATAAGEQATQHVAELTRVMEKDLFRILTLEEQSALEGLLLKIIDDQKLAVGVHPAFRQIVEGETVNE